MTFRIEDLCPSASARLPTIVCHVPSPGVNDTSLLHCSHPSTFSRGPVRESPSEPGQVDTRYLLNTRYLTQDTNRGHVLAAALCIVAAKVGLVQADYLARYQVPGGCG